MAKFKSRKFSPSKRRAESEGKRIQFRKIRRKRPTKSLWLLAALVIIVLIFFLYLKGIL